MLGQVKINIFGYPTLINIIPSKCLEIENHCYPFKSTITFTIPARQLHFMLIYKIQKSEGYVPQLHIQDGVYVGDAVVKNLKNYQSQ